MNVIINRPCVIMVGYHRKGGIRLGGNRKAPTTRFH